MRSRTAARPERHSRDRRDVERDAFLEDAAVCATRGNDDQLLVKAELQRGVQAAHREPIPVAACGSA